MDQNSTMCRIIVRVCERRFPYGTRITREGLSKVDEAEMFLRSLGIRQLRVRHHGEIARIEVSEEDMTTLIQKRNKIAGRLRSFDDMMNLVLESAKERDPQSKEVKRHVGTLFIRGNNVLFITVEE